MKFFREKTKNHSIIMGRKTFESVGKPLPNRLNVIITRQKDYKAEGAHICATIEEAIEYCKSKADKYGDEIFIIGGGEIYKQSMDQVDLIYLTRIHKEFEGDAKYPDVNPLFFEEIERREHLELPIPFSFLTYSRKDVAG